MMRNWLVLLGLCACAGAASAQVAEFSFSGGVSRFGGASLGTITQTITDPKINIADGFRLALRMTLNSYRFFGHEFGYAYSHSKLSVPATAGAASQEVPVPIHQGFYDFLAYATPEGSRIRPFAAGGGQFSSFFPPGTSAYYGNQVTKFGFNFGGGIKVKIKEPFGLRLDVRQYNSGKPFDYPNQSGRLKQTEVSAGLSFNL